MITITINCDTPAMAAVYLNAINLADDDPARFLLTPNSPAIASGFGDISGQKPLTEAQAVVFPDQPAPIGQVGEPDGGITKPPTKRRGRKPKAKAKERPAPTPEPEAPAELSVETLSAKLEMFAHKHGFKYARELLVSFKVKRVSELPEDVYEAFNVAMQSAPADAE